MIWAVAHTYNTMGWQFWSIGDYENAIAGYQQAQQVSRQIGNEVHLARILNNTGAVYYQWGRYALALEHYLESLELREKLQDDGGSALVLNNIARLIKIWTTPTRPWSFFKGT